MDEDTNVSHGLITLVWWVLVVNSIHENVPNIVYEDVSHTYAETNPVEGLIPVLPLAEVHNLAIIGVEPPLEEHGERDAHNSPRIPLYSLFEAEEVEISDRSLSLFLGIGL
jgi:hypothetical protein